ncbi:MAG: HAD family hydrolase [Candidatus Thermochlorobacter sp.]
MKSAQAILFSLDVLTKQKTECEETNELYMDISALQFPHLHQHLALHDIQKIAESSLIVFNACVEQTMLRELQAPNFAFVVSRAITQALQREPSIDEISEIMMVLRRMTNLSISRRLSACLIALQCSGYMLGILANTPLSAFILADALDDLGLVRRFETIITSSDAGYFKPNPKVFELAIESLRCEPENVIVVGSDLERDLLPIEHLSIKKVYINNHRKRQKLPKGFYRISTLEELPELDLKKVLRGD